MINGVRQVHGTRQVNGPRQTVALIDLAVDSNTSRSRRDTAMRRLDGLTLLEWCIRRLAETTLVDTIVVSGPPSVQSVLANACLCDARWVTLLEPNPSQRALTIAESFNADWVVHVHPACPFLDPALIDRLVARGLSDSELDFVGFAAPASPNFSLQRLGLVAEMSSAKGLAKIHADGLQNDPLDVPQLIRLHAELFRSLWINLPSQLMSESLRFSMETEDDWDRAGTYMEVLGEDLSWQSLAAVANRTRDR